MKYNNEQIIKYSKPLSDTEKEHCKSSISVFLDVLKKNGFTVNVVPMNNEDDDFEDYHLKKDGVNYSLIIQGSYGNKTCVRQDSDIDIAVVCKTTFRPVYRPGASGKDYGFVNSSYSIQEFKNELVNLIRDSGYSCRKNNKCIDFKGNGSSRKDMDIVPALEFRNYKYEKYNNPDDFIPGILIKCDNGQEITNYPIQCKLNSTRKNNETHHYYKKIVRIFKNIKNDMLDSNIFSSFEISSFAVECLAYNIPNNYFLTENEHNELKSHFFNCVRYLKKNVDNIKNYKESNGILNIFDNPKNSFEIYKSFINELCKWIEL